MPPPKSLDACIGDKATFLVSDPSLSPVIKDALKMVLLHAQNAIPSQSPVARSRAFYASELNNKGVEEKTKESLRVVARALDDRLIKDIEADCAPLPQNPAPRQR